MGTGPKLPVVVQGIAEGAMNKPKDGWDLDAAIEASDKKYDLESAARSESAKDHALAKLKGSIEAQFRELSKSARQPNALTMLDRAQGAMGALIDRSVRPRAEGTEIGGVDRREADENNTEFVGSQGKKKPTGFPRKGDVTLLAGKR